GEVRRYSFRTGPAAPQTEVSQFQPVNALSLDFHHHPSVRYLLRPHRQARKSRKNRSRRTGNGVKLSLCGGIGCKNCKFCKLGAKGPLRGNGVSQESLAKAMRVSIGRAQQPRSTADYRTAAKITHDSHGLRTVA